MASEFVRMMLRAWDPNAEQVEEKYWGAAVALTHSNGGQMSLAIMNPGGYSSIHFHKKKVNVFYCIHGEMLIKEWGDNQAFESIESPPLRNHLLKAGDAIHMPAQRVHQMIASLPSVCLESYYALNGQRVCLNDIHRYTVGGCADGV